MKKTIYILGTLLVLSACMIAMLYTAAERYGSDVDRTSSTIDSLAQQLFFDNRAKGIIEVFTLPPYPDHSGAHPSIRFVEQGGYTVMVRTLYVDQRRDSHVGEAFVEHSQGEVFGFACSQWDKDRELSLLLIKLLSGAHRNAHLKWQEIQREGEDHPEVARSVRAIGTGYNSRLLDYARWRWGSNPDLAQVDKEWMIIGSDKEDIQSTTNLPVSSKNSSSNE